MAAKKPIITLLTDFGVSDHFVGTMKGVILTIHPEAMIVDISHQVPPHDIFQAAFLLKQAYSYFPSGTIHVVVVDPGVGTTRRPLLATTEKALFVAPDNGVLSYIYAADHISDVRAVSADHYFLKPRSGTFDGRDVFAPVAAWLAKGVSLSAFGESITDYKRFEIPQVVSAQPGIWKGKIVYVDRFGNLISNLSRDQFKEILDTSEKRRFAFRVGEQTISKISQSYAEGGPDELIAIFGSTGALEFSVNQGNAAQIASIGAGKDFWLKAL